MFNDIYDIYWNDRLKTISLKPNFIKYQIERELTLFPTVSIINEASILIIF